jgi:phage shock protein E
MNPSLLAFTFTVAAGLAAVSSGAADPDAIHNPAIDTDGYREMTLEALAHRESRRISETEFIRMSREPGTIVLDARSPDKYAELHVKGAINLSFPDITIESVQRVLPDKSARILIYCNNNFTGAERAFPAKTFSAALNLSTYTSLYTYGYRNVYELGPLLDIHRSKLELEGSAAN